MTTFTIEPMQRGVMREFWEHENVNSHDAPGRMLATWDFPYRRIILLPLSFRPLRTVHEIGCGSGPNLKLIQQARPDLTLSGGELRPEFAAYARDHLGLPVTTEPLPDACPWNRDCVLSVFTLAYMTPGEVIEVLRRLHEQGNATLILAEPMATFQEPNGFYQYGETIPIWRYDYADLLPQTGWSPERWWTYPETGHRITAAVYAERV